MANRPPGTPVKAGDPGWDAEATLAFQSTNLNYLQQLQDVGAGQKWRLNYGPNGVAPLASLFIVVVERKGNNPFSIEAFDALNNSLGTLSVPTDDYAGTGSWTRRWVISSYRPWARRCEGCDRENFQSFKE